jgi:peroxin-4
LESTCRAIIALLGTPDATSPLNCDVSNLYRAGDVIGANSLVRMYTLDYASTQLPPVTTVSKKM